MVRESRTRRTLFRHPLAAVGGALFLAGGFLFLILVLYDLTSGEDNPYRALVTFVAAPAVFLLGFFLFLVSVWLQVRAARKRGERVRFNLSIDPSDPAYLRNLWIFLGLSALLIVTVAFAGTSAYDATESVGFCGTTCHSVMSPQYVTYLNSPHARVPCVECHIGPGASFWVKSKIDGLRQVIATAMNSYARPIETPVHNLRPAQETCEHCHWPSQFYGDKLVTRTYYRTDEDNSPWTISLRVKIGGGNPSEGRIEGIHWHMITKSKIEYVAVDEKRQTIAWTRAIRSNGDTLVYVNEEEEMPDLNDPATVIRRFDCMDCHNRPSHKFRAPATATNLALSTRKMSPELPYIREQAIELLNAEYETSDQALAAIGTGLVDYYSEEYPDIATDEAGDIAQAADVLRGIYAQNFFPEMNTDYRVRENNLSHFVNDGCFRCHNPSVVDDQGNTLARECSTCHVIVGQGAGESLNDLETNLVGLEFEHPEDIDGFWSEVNCTECHTPESGY